MYSHAFMFASTCNYKKIRNDSIETMRPKGEGIIYFILNNNHINYM